MRYLIFLLLVSTTLWGAKVLSYNVYDRSDRVDVMITFDTPYEGIIRQNQQNSSFIIKLEEASIEEAKSKTIESKYLNRVDILPQENSVEIVARANDNISMMASKTADSYGLRLRFSTKTDAPSLINQTNSPLPTKSDNELSYSYYVVIAILLIGVGVLFYLKQSITKKLPPQPRKNAQPWLFEDKQPPIEPVVATTPSIVGSDAAISVRFQKKLDEQNSVVMLVYGDMSYLMLLGQNPILLDKFKDNVAITQSDFENLLHNKRQELDNYFTLESPVRDSFDTYKEKASREY